MDNQTCLDAYDYTGNLVGIFAGVKGGPIVGPFVGVTTDYVIDSIGESVCRGQWLEPDNIHGAWDCGKLGDCDTQYQDNGF